MSKQNSHTYHSFLVRLWRVKAAKGYTWRASVEQVDSGVLKGFANLDELMYFLRQLTSEVQEINEREKSNES